MTVDHTAVKISHPKLLSFSLLRYSLFDIRHSLTPVSFPDTMGVSGQLKPARNGHFLKPKTSHPV